MKFYAIFFVLIGVTLHLGVGAPLEEHEVVDDTNEAPLDEDQVVDETTLAPLDEDTNEVLELPTERNETIKGYVFEAVDPEEEGTEGESGDGSHPPQILVLIEDDSTNSEESNDDIFPKEILFLLENNSTLLGDEPFGPYSHPDLIQEAQEDPKVLKVDTVQSLFHLLPSLNATDNSENETSVMNESQNETRSENDEEDKGGDETKAESIVSTDSEDDLGSQTNLNNNELEEKETESKDTPKENSELDIGDSTTFD